MAGGHTIMGRRMRRPIRDRASGDLRDLPSLPVYPPRGRGDRDTIDRP